ncbi:MAG: DUF268 domain-containing protein [Methanosarcinaceae archaeon]
MKALLSSLKRYTLFLKDFVTFKHQHSKQKKRHSLLWKNRYPCLHDNTKQTYFDRHYVYHTAWAARIVAKIKPKIHHDISSSLYFSSIVSAFIPVNFYDYRPAKLLVRHSLKGDDVDLSNLSSAHADLMKLPFASQSVHSLSCMHVVEHIGLGRYGDPINPEGDLQAMHELQRVVAPEGSLIFVVPIGKPKIMFNAHRVYSYDEIISNFSELTLQEFALIPDDPSTPNGYAAAGSEKLGIVIDAKIDFVNEQNYGCGCFWFRRG